MTATYVISSMIYIIYSQTKLSNVSDSLSAAQNQISQQLSQFKGLEGETQDHRDRMAVLDSEHSYLLVRVADLTEEKHSLEAENLLVKYAKEATFTSLAALQADHEQVCLCLFVYYCICILLLNTTTTLKL